MTGRTTPWSSAPGPTDWSPPTTWWTRAGRCSCSRRSPTSAVRCAAPRTSHPGFVHDTFSAFYPLAAASPTIRSFRPRGARPDAGGTRRPCSGHPPPDGSWALLHRDRDVTAGAAGRAAPRRRRRLARAVRAVGPDRRRSWSARCSRRSRRCGTGSAALARLRSVGGLELRQDAADAGRRARAAPGSAATAPRLLLAGNAGHADIPLDAPGSGPDGRC